MPDPPKPKVKAADRNKHRPEPGGAQLEHAIMTLLAERGPGKTICPSEVARAVAHSSATAWQPLMEPAREAARRLVEKQQIVITQRGHIVDLATAKGPIRLRLR